MNERLTGRGAEPSGGRIPWVDVAKGLGMLMVVYGHARGPSNLIVYLFHMPLFFLISGYLYREKGDFVSFLVRKVKSIYLPYVGWNLILILLQLGAAYLADTLTMDMVKKYARLQFFIFLGVEKDGTYLGATWFMGGLFLISVLYKLLDYYIEDGPGKVEWITLLFAVNAVVASYITYSHFVSRIIIMGSFFAVGRLVRVYQESWKKMNCPLVFLFALPLFLILARETRTDLGKNEYTNRGLCLIAAFLGIYLTCCLAMWLSKRRSRIMGVLKRGLLVCGKNSMDILIWHFVAFRLVSLFQFWKLGEEIPDGLKKNVYETGGYWWFAYFVVGLVVPLAWGWLLRQGPWGKWLKKTCLVR